MMPAHWVKLRSVWRGMRKRCMDPEQISYRYYGGRGISVCSEWHEFEPFYAWAIDNGYRPGLAIDRRNNDGNYEPGNCRWVTSEVNARNKRNNRNIEIFGATKTATEWSADPRCAVSRARLVRRINAGWTPERALTEPQFVSSSAGSHCRAVSMEIYQAVMAMIADGHSNMEIKRRLGVSDVFASLARRGKTWHASRAPLFEKPPAVQRNLLEADSA